MFPTAVCAVTWPRSFSAPPLAALPEQRKASLEQASLRRLLRSRPRHLRRRVLDFAKLARNSDPTHSAFSRPTGCRKVYSSIIDRLCKRHSPRRVSNASRQAWPQMGHAPLLALLLTASILQQCSAWPGEGALQAGRESCRRHAVIESRPMSAPPLPLCAAWLPDFNIESLRSRPARSVAVQVRDAAPCASCTALPHPFPQLPVPHFSPGFAPMRRQLQEGPTVGRLSGILRFPYGLCSSDGSGSPYLLDGPAPTVVDGIMRINLTVVENPDANATACRVPGKACQSCYQNLLNNAYKLHIKTGGHPPQALQC